MATGLPIKFASVSAASSGNNTIVSAVSNKRIRVISYVLVASGSVSVKWRSANTDVSGAMPLTANSGVAPGEAHSGHLQTEVNEALNLNLSGAVGVYGHVTYNEVSD